MGEPVEITHLLKHVVRGEDRWTGRLVLPGRGSLNVLVVPVGGRLVAVQLRCPHMDRDLTKGSIVDACAIECPSHGWVIPLTSLYGQEVTATPEGRLFAQGPFIAPEGGEDGTVGELTGGL